MCEFNYIHDKPTCRNQTDENENGTYGHSPTISTSTNTTIPALNRVRWLGVGGLGKGDHDDDGNGDDEEGGGVEEQEEEEEEDEEEDSERRT